MFFFQAMTLPVFVPDRVGAFGYVFVDTIHAQEVAV